jgi:hypothetical protein
MNDPLAAISFPHKTNTGDFHKLGWQRSAEGQASHELFSTIPICDSRGHKRRNRSQKSLICVESWQRWNLYVTPANSNEHGTTWRSLQHYVLCGLRTRSSWLRRRLG